MKISNKMKLDVDSMFYFVPDGFQHMITEQDKESMAIYSATGKPPETLTEGFSSLKWGKTYRDEWITSIRDSLFEGIITKAEIVYDMPKNLKKWAWDKIKDFPYNGDTAFMMHDILSMSKSERLVLDHSFSLIIKTIIDIHESGSNRDMREILLGL